MANTKNAGEANLFNWDLFLRQWSRDLLERLEDSEFAILPSEVIEARWLGYLGAADAEIDQAQTRMNTTFPPSYRNFLAVSNGWRKLDDLIGRLLSIQEIEWLATRNQEFINAWTTGVAIGGGLFSVSDEAYFVYGDEQDTSLLRDDYLQTALEIGGNPEQGLLLLNPQVTFEDGEWEAWLFANWLPGTVRYRSFREFMQDRHSSLLDSLPKLRELP